MWRRSQVYLIVKEAFGPARSLRRAARAAPTGYATARPRTKAANYDSGSERLSFTSDPTGGDGVILDTDSNQTFLTEHVMIPRPLSTKEVQDPAPVEVQILMTRLNAQAVQAPVLVPQFAQRSVQLWMLLQIIGTGALKLPYGLAHRVESKRSDGPARALLDFEFDFVCLDRFVT